MARARARPTATRWAWGRRPADPTCTLTGSMRRAPDQPASSGCRHQHVVSSRCLKLAGVCAAKSCRCLFDELLAAIVVDSLHADRAEPPAGELRDELIRRLPTHFLLDELDFGRGKAGVKRLLPEPLKVRDHIACGFLVDGLWRRHEPA